MTIATTNYATSAYETERSLTTHEQEKLTKAINSLSGSKLTQVLSIIQKETNMDDEEDVQMGVDELPNATQVKLYEMLVKNKGEGTGAASDVSLAGGLGGGMGYNPMSVASYSVNQAVAGAAGAGGDTEAQEDQILEFNEFDSSNLEDDVVLNGSGLGLGDDMNGFKADDDDWAAARDQAKTANQFKADDDDWAAARDQ